MSRKDRGIKKEEYYARIEQGIPVGNCWVDMGNGELVYALHEVVIVGVPQNKYGDRTFERLEVSFLAVADKTRVDIRNTDTQVNLVKRVAEHEQRKKEARENIAKKVSDYFAKKKREIPFGTQENATRMKSLLLDEKVLMAAIANDNMYLSVKSFPFDLYVQNTQQINEFLKTRTVTLTANSSTEEEEVGFWESIIPVVGSAKEAELKFKHGHYWQGIAFSLLAVSDVFLLKSIAAGLLKGAWKSAGSHSWNATRKWALKNGWTEPREPLHHWFIHQETAKKYGIEHISNQPWNLMPFIDNASHTRFGHGLPFKGLPAGTPLQQFWYGNPHWFKNTVTNVGGHTIMNSADPADEK